MKYTLTTRSTDVDEGRTRTYWCPDGGGYVREIDDTHPGTLGQQVSDRLGYVGDMMVADERTLAIRIKRARRRELAALRNSMY